MSQGRVSIELKNGLKFFHFFLLVFQDYLIACGDNDVPVGDVHYFATVFDECFP